eukprot:UN26228
MIEVSWDNGGEPMDDEWIGFSDVIAEYYPDYVWSISVDYEEECPCGGESEVIQERSIICVIHGVMVLDNLCDPDTKPQTTRVCSVECYIIDDFSQWTDNTKRETSEGDLHGWGNEITSVTGIFPIPAHNGIIVNIRVWAGGCIDGEDIYISIDGEQVWTRDFMRSYVEDKYVMTDGWCSEENAGHVEGYIGAGLGGKSTDPCFNWQCYQDLSFSYPDHTSDPLTIVISWDNGSEVMGDEWIGFSDVMIEYFKETLTPTVVPTLNPTLVPTDLPTLKPTKLPTCMPTTVPTTAPTSAPTKQPTLQPTVVPTYAPTKQPTLIPTHHPTLTPTYHPTKDPTTSEPTSDPTPGPTPFPTNQCVRYVCEPDLARYDTDIRNLDETAETLWNDFKEQQSYVEDNLKEIDALKSDNVL